MGKTLGELLGFEGPMTHREYLTWMARFELQWNTPNRTDYFLLRIAQRVHQSMVKHPNSVKLEDQMVRFGREGEQPQQQMDADTATMQSKSRWGALFSAAKDAAKQAARKTGEIITGERLDRGD